MRCRESIAGIEEKLGVNRKRNNPIKYREPEQAMSRGNEREPDQTVRDGKREVQEAIRFKEHWELTIRKIRD